MRWIEKLERRFGGWAIPNLTNYLLGLQLIGLVLVFGKGAPVSDLMLVGGKVFEGEWWRLFSFLMIPPNTHPIFLFFAYYFIYIMGSALEEQWGAFKYNLFIFIACVATVLAAFMVPSGAMTNAFIGTSIFLAFAYLFPDFEILLMLVFPVKIKWLAWLTWAGFALSLLVGDAAIRLSVIASVSNYFLFFGRDIYRSVKSGKRRSVYKKKQIQEDSVPMHVCAVCGVSDKTDPTKLFRYCSKCGDCFCEDHLENHPHPKKLGGE